MQLAPAVKSALPYIRFLKSASMGQGSYKAALAYAEAIPHTPTSVLLALKAAVTAQSREDDQPIAEVTALRDAFLPLLREVSLLDRVAGWRVVPFASATLAVDAAPEFGWVAEGAPLPAGRMNLSRQTVNVAKLGGVVPFTRETIQNAAPSADAIVALDIARAVGRFCARAFLQPSFAAVAYQQPAAITNGAASVASAGSTAANVKSDLNRLLAQFNGDLSRAVFVMHPKSAAYLNTLDPVFESVNARGGQLLGLPVFTSEACEIVESPVQRFIVLMQPDGILMADGGTDIVASDSATLQLRDDPVSGAAQLVSLFQNNLMAYRVMRTISWERGTDDAVAVLTGCAY